MSPLEVDILRPSPAPVSIALEPVPNALNSLVLLTMVDQLSGLGEWVSRTSAALPPARRHTNRVVCEGLYYAIQPDRRWTSFPTYIDGLAAQPPEALRDRFFHNLLRDVCIHAARPDASAVADRAALESSVDAYLEFLRTQFGGIEIDEGIETETHTLVNDPPRMHDLVVSHLRTMWDEVLATEWERVQPVLQESIYAFQQFDLNARTPLEAARLVTGQELNEKWEQMVSGAKQVIFVPSAHVGPYVRKIFTDQYLWILFGARLPAGAAPSTSALGRSELLVRFGALNDDTRLRILALISRYSELRAQDVMARLDLTQSAASRHLRQLSATGLLIERWRDGAKCYTLNRERITDTFRALEHYLVQPES
jgi:DNA-binding transcriptional ArsR family regulator